VLVVKTNVSWRAGAECTCKTWLVKLSPKLIFGLQIFLGVAASDPLLPWH
jgi:hypothetical protein